MCVAVVAIGMSKDFPFVLAHNRDEFYNRPSLPIALSKAGVAGGIDERSGGMWLGVRQGTPESFAFVTNFRRFPLVKGNFRSRGELVKNFLESPGDAGDYINRIDLPSYPAFTLVLGTLEKVTAFHSVDCEMLTAESGIHAFSNGDLNADWEKVHRLKRGVRGILSANLSQEFLVKNLFEMLHDGTAAPIDKLPQTGVSLEFEHALSSVFVKTPDYGTVASTVILKTETGVKMWERRFERRGPVVRNLNL